MGLVGGGIFGYWIRDINVIIHLPEQLISFIGTFFMILSGTIYLLLRYPIDFKIFGFDSSNILNTFAWGVGGGIICSLIGFPYGFLLGENDIPQDFYIPLDLGGHLVFVFLFVAVLLIPCIEEIFFRGCIFRVLKNTFNPFWGYFGSTAVFVLGHGISEPNEVIFFTINSVILAYLYDKTNLIGTSIIAHAMWSATWFATLYIRAL
jgi:membrane protease YdiL (CAAX protease family)